MGNVDIIMPVYNPGAYFLDSVKSIICQSYTSWRLLLVDDGSGDEFKQVIKTLSDSDDRIQLITLDRNYGGGYARNIALDHVDAEFIAFCDSDDVWPPDKLKKQIDYLRNHEFANMTHTDMLRIQEAQEVLVPVPDQIDIKTFLSGTQLFCSSVVLRKAIVKDARFGVMKARHPFKFWCDIMSKGEISYKVKDTYFRYLVRPGSVSSDKFKMLYYTILAYLFYAPFKFYTFHAMLKRSGRFITGGR